MLVSPLGGEVFAQQSKESVHNGECKILNVPLKSPYLFVGDIISNQLSGRKENFQKKFGRFKSRCTFALPTADNGSAEGKKVLFKRK